MRISRRLAWAFVTLGVLGVLTQGWPQGTVRARLLSTQGLVKVKRAASREWTRATLPLYSLLFARDEVQTYQHAQASLAIGGSRMVMAPLTRVTIPAWDRSSHGTSTSPLEVLTGRVLMWLIGSRPVILGAPGGTASARGTKFVMEVNEQGLTTVTVLEGHVAFQNQRGTVVVGPGEQSTATPSTAPTRPQRVDTSGFFQWEATLDHLWLGYEQLNHPIETPERLATMTATAVQKAASAPNDAEAQAQAGDLLHDTGQLTEAGDAYERALKLAPGRSDLLMRQGYNLLQQGQRLEAEAVFEQAAKAAPRDPLPLLGQAVALISSLDDTKLATAQQLLTRADGLGAPAAQAGVLSGLLALREGGAAAARQAFERAAKADARSYQALAFLAVTLLAEGKGPAAEQAARQAVTLAPASALAHEALGTALFFTGDLAEAAREADTALRLCPSAASAHLLCSDSAVAQGDLETGLQEAQTAIALNPLLAPAYQALGMIALAQNDLNLAHRSFTRALELQPRLVAARTGMGVTYARQGKLATALEMQEGAVALESSSAATHNNLGVLYLSLGRLDDALTELQKAVQLQPQWSLPHANLALVHLEANRFAQAATEGETAVRLGEESARVHTTLARVYIKQGRTSLAQSQLRRALDLDEHYALAHMHLAEVYTTQERSRDALRERLKALSQQPSSMLDNRSYARTEAWAEAGSFAGGIKTEGRGDDGQNSYYVNTAVQFDDAGRARTRFDSQTALGIFGRQTSADHTVVGLMSLQRDARDRPGRQIAGLPEDDDYTALFEAGEIHALTRRPIWGKGQLTLKLGYRSAWERDRDPDSLVGDSYPFPLLKMASDGPLAEARLDKRLGRKGDLTAGLALTRQRQRIWGTYGTVSPPDPPVFSPFGNQEYLLQGTAYAEFQRPLNDQTRLLLGARLATGEGMTPVLRGKLVLRRELGKRATLVLLTRPLLADDVSELSPVDRWGLGDPISPLSLGTGGYSQSYEVQYELRPVDGSLLRLAAFHRDLRTYIIDLADPTWSVGAVGTVMGTGNIQGVEAQWEQQLKQRLSTGLTLRLADSSNGDAGDADIPYQPKLFGQVQLNYLDEAGWRVGLTWLYVGQRYADVANVTRLGSYGTANLAVAKQQNLQTSYFLGVENLTDQGQGYWAGYPSRGRKLSAGVEYRF